MAEIAQVAEQIPVVIVIVAVTVVAVPALVVILGVAARVTVVAPVEEGLLEAWQHFTLTLVILRLR